MCSFSGMISSCRILMNRFRGKAAFTVTSSLFDKHVYCRFAPDANMVLRRYGKKALDRPESIWLSGDPVPDKAPITDHIDRTKPILAVRNSTKLEMADPIVKQLLSIQYGRKKEIWNDERKRLVSAAQRHPDDTRSMQSYIAHLTVDIRQLQEHMRLYRTDRLHKSQLIELIDRRRKMLKYLRTWDYKLFLWVLDQLNIKYQTRCELFKKVTRKQRLREEAEQKAADMEKQKMEDFRQKLEKDREQFESEKATLLHEIEEDEKQFNITPEETEYKHVPDELEV